MTAFLVDTHALLWWLSSPERLSDAARGAIAGGENALLWSTASSWEVAVKYSVGKLALPEPPARFLPPLLARVGVGSLPVLDAHAWRVAALPFHHRDPFDRLLIAQAIIEALPVVTADLRFAAYGVAVVW